MAEVLSLSLSFPAVIYTALLGVVLVYWLFVIVGAIGCDVLQGARAVTGRLAGNCRLKVLDDHWHAGERTVAGQ